jgi:acyl-CoA thioester hydrolase
MNHVVTYRVYYEDTDAGGIMYHGNFINFCERARTEFINSRGLSNKALHQEDVLAVVRHIEADYLSPAYLEDFVRIETSVVEIKNSSFILQQTIFRGEDTLFNMKVVLVCINGMKRPVRIPDVIKKILE